MKKSVIAFFLLLYVGVEFDPEKVGFEITEVKNKSSEFKVEDSNGNRQRGNSNLGHIWGTHLETPEKDALIEYMKTL